MLLTELQIGICGDDEMIRKYVDGDIDAVMQIWLNTNIEYSRAVTPQIRQAGNRLSGLAETAYASLLA